MSNELSSNLSSRYNLYKKDGLDRKELGKLKQIIENEKRPELQDVKDISKDLSEKTVLETEDKELVESIGERLDKNDIGRFEESIKPIDDRVSSLMKKGFDKKMVLGNLEPIYLSDKAFKGLQIIASSKKGISYEGFSFLLKKNMVTQSQYGKLVKLLDTIKFQNNGKTDTNKFLETVKNLNNPSTHEIANKVLSKSIKEVIFSSDRKRDITDIAADFLNFTNVASNRVFSGTVSGFGAMDENKLKLINNNTKLTNSGNCQEMAVVTAVNAREIGASRVELFEIKNHLFTVINRDKGSKENDPMTWGGDCMVIDTWAQKTFKASDYYNNSEMKSQQPSLYYELSK